MSTAIIKFEETPDMMCYCTHDSYPAGLGFDLLNVSESDKKFISFLVSDTMRFQFVQEIPKDIQYEYVILKNGNVHCQESWWADKNYHGGGFRHGGTYDLKSWKEKIRLLNEYCYRRPEYWT